MKKFFSLIAAVLFAGSMMADVVTFTKDDFAGQGTANTGSEVSATKGGVTFTYSKGYCADESLRCYAHGALSITASSTIEKINFTTTGGKTGGLDEEVTVGSNSYEVEDLASQARFTEIAVTLGEGGGSGEGGEGGEGEEGEYTYDYEPTEVTTINIAATNCKIEDYTADYGVVYIELSDADDNWASLEFIASSYAGALPAGTYQINDSETEGTFFASPGGDDEYDYGCYVGIMAGEYYNPYYMISGTVTIEANGNIAVHATSYNGSTLNITYEAGEVPPVDPGEGDEIIFTREDFIGQGTANTGSEVTATKGGVTFTYSKGYCADESLRCYAHGSLSITSSAEIATIHFTTTGGKTGGLDEEVTVNATSYVVEDLASQARFTEVKVVLAGGTTGIEETLAEGKAVKVVRDGMVLILKGDKTFNMMGQIVR